MDDVENWCTDNMFVYVDADEKQQIKSEDEFEDKVGIPLLLETLEANLWDGLVLKSSSQAPSEIDSRLYFTTLAFCTKYGELIF